MMADAGERGGRRREAGLSARRCGPPCVWPRFGAEGRVQVNALGRFPVKGLADPVEVFELIGASAIRRRLQASAARGLTRFVGRQQRLTALQQALRSLSLEEVQALADHLE